MKHLLRIAVFLILAVLLPLSVWSRPQESASVSDSGAAPHRASHTATASVPRVFAIPVSAKSPEARKLVEKALDQYENVLLDDSVETAKKAVEKDPQFALAYAVWSFAARRTQPAPEALRKAEEFAPAAPPEEQLLVNFLVSVQKEDMLPAIASMNDLLKRFPRNAHVLYLTSEWLYFQQDYDRSLKMMEEIVRIDPKFAPAFNMLGYGQVESGNPDPVKAITYLKRYAELQPGQPNPEDSLGEVSRYVGDDASSIAHYTAALKITPTFLTSQTGLGDTYTLMGRYPEARKAYDKATAMAASDRDRLHVLFQKTLALFWQGKGEDGLRELDRLAAEAREVREPYAEFEIEEGRALLTPDPAEQLVLLRALEARFSVSLTGMSDSDRGPSLASVWRDQVRILAAQKQFDEANLLVGKLEQLSAKSRDLIVEDCYESARGYILFAQGDFVAAQGELSADPHSALAAQWLIAAREHIGDKKGADAARLRLKYLRAPTVEWYLAHHPQAQTN